MKVKEVENSGENWQADLSCQRELCAKIGASRFSRLRAVHNRTYRDARTDERADVQPAWISPLHLRWNGLKNTERAVGQYNYTSAGAFL